jgi:hypothetical protein
MGTTRKRFGPNLRVRIGAPKKGLRPSPTQDPKLWWQLTCALVPDCGGDLARLEELSGKAHEEDLRHLGVYRGVQSERNVDGCSIGRPRAAMGRFKRRELREYARALYAAIEKAALRKGEKLTPKQIRLRMVKDILGHCAEWRYDLPSAKRHWIADDPAEVAERIRYLLQ